MSSSFNTSDIRIKVVVLSAFFLSGLSALIYQVVWMRMLTLVFGTTVFAAATVITVFMAGLAVGSYLFGRLVDKRAGSINLLRLYAIIEAGIALYCLFTPWAFSGLEVIYGYIYSLSEINFYLFSLVRFFFSSLVLFIPTVLLGATLPVISKFYVRENSAIGKGVGRLYGLNTLGAVVGVLITAFILIPMLGVKASLLFAVAINSSIAAVTWYFSRSLPTDAGVTEVKSARKLKRDGSIATPSRNIRLMVLVVFAISGFASLAYEVAWFRILSMTIGNTVYAFSVMLATLLFGLALGSYIVSIFIDRVKDKLRLFAFIELLIGLFSIAFIPLVGKLPLVFMGILEYTAVSFWGFQMVNFLTAFVAMIVPTLLMGATLPVAVRLMTEELSGLGTNIGELYGINTLGGVLGSFLAGFVLLPFIGVQTTIVLMASLNIIVGCVLLFRSELISLSWKRGLAVFGAIVIVAALLLPRWDRAVLLSGTYLYGPKYMESFSKGVLEEELKQINKIIYYDEGVTGTTAVVDRPGNRILFVNGKGIADTKSDIFTHTLLGSLPLMLHSAPESALLIGVGSGVTLGAMEQFPLREIEAVELSAEVVEAARLFDDYNYNALDDERLNLIVDDGRSYLSYSDKLYDVIVSQPSVPWMSGASNLYTTEFYEAVRASLKPGGITCQWIQAYNMEMEDVKILIRTFKNVFSHANLWIFEAGNILLLGSPEQMAMPYSQMLRNFSDPDIGSMVRAIGITHPEMFVGGFTMGSNDLLRFTEETLLNTDNNALIEFSSPKSFFKPTAEANYNEMAEFAPSVNPIVAAMVRRAGKTRYRIPSFYLDTTLGKPWRLSYAGFDIRNNPIEVTGSDVAYVSKGVKSFIEWQRGKKDGIDTEVGEYARDKSLGGEDVGWLRLRIKDVGTRKLTNSELFNNLNARGRYIADGKSKVDSNALLWSLNESRGGGEAVLSLAWHCAENGLVYIGKYTPAPSTKEGAEKIIKELSSGFTCLPRREDY